MKNLILNIFLLASLSACAQSKNVTSPPKYDAAVRFNSICCGTASAEFLKNFIKSFNYENKVAITAFKKGGCGREGEFYILFSLSDIKENAQAAFKKGLEELMPKVNEQTRSQNTNKGTVQFFDEINPAQLEGCRSEITPWIYNN